MSIELDDLIGLNRTRVAGMPIVSSQTVAQEILSAAPGAPSLAIAGMRYSQGGHTTLHDGQVMLTETMRRVSYDPITQTVTAGGGANWSQIHHVLQPHSRAPRVHQSSAHFTVGGSLSVNCHGRDPSEGPLSETVLCIKVLCGTGATVTATPTENADLFRAVIGGYGSCGLILEATLHTTTNSGLTEIWHRRSTVEQYQEKHLAYLPKCRIKDQHDGSDIHLHYGWLCCVDNDDFLQEVVYCDYVDFAQSNADIPQSGRLPDPNAPLKEEGWGTSEILRASWAAARSDARFKAELWAELKNPKSFTRQYPNDWRINWMRVAVSFTATRGGPVNKKGDKVEILQEYFVPLAKFKDMVKELRKALRAGNPAGINLLFCTIRLVQQEKTGTVLSYARSSRMVCIALDATVPVDGKTGTRAPTAAVRETFSGLIDHAIGLGGTFYLPYWRFANKDQFDAGYPGAKAALLAAIQKYNPQRKFCNSFLQEYI